MFSTLLGKYLGVELLGCAGNVWINCLSSCQTTIQGGAPFNSPAGSALLPTAPHPPQTFLLRLLHFFCGGGGGGDVYLFIYF